MRLALLGPVSPVELARRVHDSVKEGRSPTAAGFQLVEISECLREIVDLPESKKWEEYRCKALKEVEALLHELIKAYPGMLGLNTAFDRYQRGICLEKEREADA